MSATPARSHFEDTPRMRDLTAHEPTETVKVGDRSLVRTFGLRTGVVSMSTRIEVTKQLKQAYKTRPESEKSKILNQFCVTTRLSRVSARRYLTSLHLDHDQKSW